MVDVTRVSKVINAPLRYTYQWCTDFREDDSKLTGSSSQRRIVEKTRKRVIYVTIYDGADDKQKVAVSYVTLKPPDAWSLEQFGEEDYEKGEYRLKSLGKDRTRLDMVFKETWKDIAKIPTIKEQTDGTSRFWDQLIAALEKDYKSR
ncbi:MAG: hypothetical protein JRN09_00965 [Nitrososphaerota archaeon]|jgi:hypothetical protein|nr:hypothetical protein [Nitrososphaerota archaeon]